jgi:hypothetical protein
MGDTIFSQRSPDYLAGVLPCVTGIRRLEKAKLFFAEEYPDVIAEEARMLWKHASQSRNSSPGIRPVSIHDPIATNVT